MATLLARAGRSYDLLLSRHRLLTTTVSGGALGCAGDAAAQYKQSAVDGTSSTLYNAERGTAFTIFGGVVTGPVNFVWLKVLERWTLRLAPAGRWRALAVKVAMQSFILQPFIYLPTFYTVTALTRHWSPDELVKRVQDTYTATLGRIWVFWTPSVIFAFGWLPMRQQAVFFAGVGFAWNVVLSLFSNPTAQVAATGESGESGARKLPER